MKTKKTAFSLFELAIVLAVVSIIMTMSIPAGTFILNQNKNKTTDERMHKIYSEIVNYLRINRKLPCPSSLVSKKLDTDYGVSVITSGECGGTGVITSGDLVYGSIPTQELNISNQFAEDGFKYKFSYVIDKRFAQKTNSLTDSAGFEYTQGIGENLVIMKVKENSVTDADPYVTKDAIMLIISHGKNREGGYSSVGGIQKTPDSNLHDSEIENISVVLSNSFDGLFVSAFDQNYFDDKVLFKNKSQLIKDAGLEFVICPLSESIDNGLQWQNAHYLETRETACINNKKYKRFCGKFGVWGQVIEEAC